MIEDKDLQAKSDQMNAVDLIDAVKFRVEKVTYNPGSDQPLAIHLEGYPGRPYKPCKGMMRGLAQAWGRDEQKWTGHIIELFCDPSVKWRGTETGGIRVSGVSHIDAPVEFAFTLNQQQRYVHTFNVIAVTEETKKQFIKTHWVSKIESAETNGQISAIVAEIQNTFDADALGQIKQNVLDARIKLKEVAGNE